MSLPSFATRWNADAIDDAYARWTQDPRAVDATWQAFFEGFALASTNGHAPGTNGATTAEASAPVGSDQAARAIKQARFTGAIYAYRSIGHTQARINPLFKEHPRNPRLSLERLGFSEADLDEVYFTGNYLGGKEMSVRELRASLDQTYCGHIGIEYLHLQETPERRWLQEKIEPVRATPKFSAAQKKRIFNRLLKAQEFERFLHTRFVGQKRFGLEGGETLIPGLDTLVQRGPDLGVVEMMMGMAHRGRLNVLANIIRKTYEYIFHEFSENFLPETKHGDGDVKYHLGYDAEVENRKGQKLTLRLAANPSHLEAVNGVVEGRTRARQRLLGDTEERKAVIPVLIHGDAAFAGQGVVAEVLNFSQLPGYATGGTIHFVINNQIGFTTDPSEARSTLYCTDVAKMIEAPIFHVNGDDPEAMAWVTGVALEYRQRFKKDVVIDMLCYRRHGHNEGDEPAFTQPLLYKKIADHPTTATIYGERLVEEGVITDDEAKAMQQRWQDELKANYDEMRRKERDGEKIIKTFEGAAAQYQPEYAFKDIATNVDKATLDHVARALTHFPDDFNINSKIKRQLKQKLTNWEQDKGVDWAFAESLAWGTLMLEGQHVRLSGQDCVRGTFSQRHSTFFDTTTRKKYIPLMEMAGRAGRLCVHNSLLSEFAVLGFDYGYSMDFPDMLCMWEAQFGDFANGAQVMIDQFISSAESKWQRVSGLVLLLPHGYEGQGPEHSSARLERFLQLCAEDNIQVANVTTPAQYFHLLRRQMKREFRKPLVLMTPKSLLRHKECVSRVEAFSDRHFLSILPDETPPETTKRVILCSGKVYYDLLAYRRDNQVRDTAVIRVEQFYPFTASLLKVTLELLGAEVDDLVWCQEEPANMGAWTFLEPRLEKALGRRARYAGRAAAASPAVGNLKRHQEEQNALLQTAFGAR